MSIVMLKMVAQVLDIVSYRVNIVRLDELCLFHAMLLDLELVPRQVTGHLLIEHLAL